MDTKEINQILKNYLYADDEIALSHIDFTTDWNYFHKVWMKYINSGGFMMKLEKPILLNPTPLEAATTLASTLKNKI